MIDSKNYANSKGNKEIAFGDKFDHKSDFNGYDRSKSQHGVHKVKVKSQIASNGTSKLKVFGLKESFLHFDQKLNEKEKRVIDQGIKEKKFEIDRTNFQTLDKINFETRKPDGFFEKEKQPKQEVTKVEDEIDFLNF